MFLIAGQVLVCLIGEKTAVCQTWGEMRDGGDWRWLARSLLLAQSQARGKKVTGNKAGGRKGAEHLEGRG